MPTVNFNTHFPGYTVLGEINRSNARVLKARHLDTGDIVAIKHFSLTTDADTLRRFERESQIMTQLDHPNVVRIREVCLDAELPYLVMDYVEGGSVRQLLTAQGSLPIETALRLGAQVVSVFRAIHQQGIVHRDVKPENILYHQLVSGELNFLVTDFGVARLHQQPVTVTGQSLMTYEYAAPEQFDNPREVNEATDYYALGVVLYECLTGHVPFALNSEAGLVTFMRAVMTSPPPAPARPDGQPLPASLERLLDELLAKQASERLCKPDVVKLALKQAEVEQLHLEASATLPPDMPSRTVAFKPQPAPNAARPDAAGLPGQPPVVIEPRQAGPAVTAKPDVARPIATEPVVARPNGTVRPDVQPAVARREPAQTSVKPIPVTEPEARMSLGPMLFFVATLLVLLGGTYWYLVLRPRAANVAQHVERPARTAKPRSATGLNARQRSEQARQRYQVQVASAIGRLDARTVGGNTGLFGGVKGLKVRLKNPSNVTFTSVAVRVQYIKENGELYKFRTMYFNNIGPGATKTREAPDSPRGTRFTARVLRADAARPDSVFALSASQP